MVWDLMAQTRRLAKEALPGAKITNQDLTIVLTFMASKQRKANNNIRSKRIISQLRSITRTLLRRSLIEMQDSVTGRQPPLVVVLA